MFHEHILQTHPAQKVQMRDELRKSENPYLDALFEGYRQGGEAYGAMIWFAQDMVPYKPLEEWHDLEISNVSKCILECLPHTTIDHDGYSQATDEVVPGCYLTTRVGFYDEQIEKALNEETRGQRVLKKEFVIERKKYKHYTADNLDYLNYRIILTTGEDILYQLTVVAKVLEYMKSIELYERNVIMNYARFGRVGELLPGAKSFRQHVEELSLV